MWMFALEEDPELEHLRDLGPEQYESCLKKLNRMHATRSRLVGKLERGAGVRDLGDRGEGKFGSERECYNGRGGGRVFKWYSRAVFNNYLGRMGVSEATCSERECMLALAASSDEIKKYPMVQSSLVPFAGPQCCTSIQVVLTIVWMSRRKRRVVVRVAMWMRVSVGRYVRIVGCSVIVASDGVSWKRMLCLRCGEKGSSRIAIPT